MYPETIVALHGGMHGHQDYAVPGVQDMFTTWKVPKTPAARGHLQLRELVRQQRDGKNSGAGFYPDRW